MGRNRKTKAAAERDGTFEKHPERKAAYENEPKPVGPLGPPPSGFDETYTGSRLRAIWEEVVSQAPPGVLTSSDRLHVEMTCRAIFRIRWLTPKASDFSMVREFLGKMAMNPADRTKVQISAGGGAGAAPAMKPNDDENQNAFAEIADEVEREGAERKSRVN